MKGIRATFIIVLLVFSSTAQAVGTDVVGCQSCTSSQASSAAAGTTVPDTMVLVYVVDWEGEELGRYRVTKVYEQGETLITVLPIAVETAEQDEFDETMSAKANPLSVVEFDIPASTGVGSAYDLWGPNRASTRQLVFDYVEDNYANILGVSMYNVLGHSGAVANYLSDKLVFVFEFTPFEIDLDFDDGSMVELQFSFTEDKELFSFFKPGTSRDSEGNLIPETSTEADDNDPDFNADGAGFGNLDNWEDLVERWGYSIPTYSRGGAGYKCTGSCDYATAVCGVVCSQP